jgi:formate/nitrite transporter FocA (FNT family)
MNIGDALCEALDRANWIACLAVRMALRKEEVAEILPLILIVFIFVYLGFEHFLPYGN